MVQSTNLLSSQEKKTQPDIMCFKYRDFDVINQLSHITHTSSSQLDQGKLQLKHKIRDNSEKRQRRLQYFQRMTSDKQSVNKFILHPPKTPCSPVKGTKCRPNSWLTTETMGGFTNLFKLFREHKFTNLPQRISWSTLQQTTVSWS